MYLYIYVYCGGICVTVPLRGMAFVRHVAVLFPCVICFVVFLMRFDVNL